jgi:predicted DsbA family dithiol-disulfide isomerase
MVGRVPLPIEHFTDPACPFAFSAEPVRLRLRWHYGEGLAWRDRMIVLTLDDPHEAARLAEGAPNLQRRYGMPIDPAPYPRLVDSAPGCRAVVAARLAHGDAAAERLLRALRVRTMSGGMLDDPALPAAAAEDAGIDLVPVDADEALAADVRAARAPAGHVVAGLRHKLGAGGTRYSAPTYVLGDGFVIPGFNPIEAYEAAIANLAPELERRPRPESAEELLAWAPYPLATAEVVLILARDEQAVRAELARTARAIPAGADCYWTL